MDMNFAYPEVKTLNKVVSSDYHCADALLVKVEGGREALAFENRGDGYQVTLNGECLFSVNEEGYCPTCGGYITRGYGRRNVSMEEAMALTGRINEPYAGIRTAVERIRPLMGLLRSGYYVVADYELFPFTENIYFWNFVGIPDQSASWGSQARMQGYAYSRCPAYMIPSQPAASCNPERIGYYANLAGSEDFPRAVGLYESGNAVLLLDGHHKAAAAASQGRMVKCLVIMPAVFDRTMDEINESRTLLYREGCLLDDSGKLVGWVSACVNRIMKGDYDKDIPLEADFSDWGSVSAKYVPDQSIYAAIPHQEMAEWIYSGKEESYIYARDSMRNYYTQPENRMAALHFLRWHQAQFDALSGGKLTPWQMPLLEKKQFAGLLHAAKKYGIDRDPKTANAVYGVFSFLPGQRRITDIPAVLAGKVKNEAVRTVLIPNTVQEVDHKVFENFPDLEEIVLEKGNPKLRPEPFRAIADRIRTKREQDRSDELHLKQYPFANLSEMLKKKQEEEQ